jgi:hypothetical protein
VTALVAARLQDGSASLSAHAGTKTMGALALSLVWLIGTLHKNLYSILGNQYLC